MKIINQFAPYVSIVVISATWLIPTNVAAEYFTSPVSPAFITNYFDHEQDEVSVERYFDGDDGTIREYDEHNGTDFDGEVGDDILAPYDGEVIGGFDTCAGHTLHMWHDDIGLSTLYAHLDSYVVSSGNVERFDHIAEMGDTGDPECVDGAHLHFGVTDGFATSSASNRIDPFGWSAPGTTTDPWPHNQGYLWTTDPPSLYVPPDFLSNLISVWLSDGSGLTSDLHGSNTMTDINTVTFLSNGGKNGDAASFNSGNNEYLEDTGLSGWHDEKESFSYAGWFKIPAIGSGQTRNLVSSSISGTGTRYFTEVNMIGTIGQLKFEIAWVSGGNQGLEFFSVTDDLDDDTWHHFAVVGRNEGGVAHGQIYIDGVLDEEASHNTLEYDLNSFLVRGRIGGLYNWSSGSTQAAMNGTLHQIAAWDKALTATEVSELYNSGSGIPFSSF